MDDLVSQLEGLIKGLDPKKRAELVAAAGPRLKQIWLPNPGPQTEAYLSLADLLLYGGAAGGGSGGVNGTVGAPGIIVLNYTPVAGCSARLTMLGAGC